MSLHWIWQKCIAAMFLESDYDYQLFIDADVAFEPDVVGSMILAEKDFICCHTERKHKTTL